MAAAGRWVRRLSNAQRTLIALIVAGLASAGVAAVELGSSAPQSSPVDTAPLNNPALLSPASATPQTAPTTVRIIVQSASINLPVAEGDGVHVPLNLALHYPRTAEPGEGSNSLFYAHGQKGMFYGLYSIHTGAEIRAVRADGSIERYLVHEIREVPWNDLEILKPTAYEQIILLTCTSYNPYDPRLLVIGTPG